MLKIRHLRPLASSYNMTLASAPILSIAGSTATLLGPNMFTVSLGVNVIYL